ncbi:MAG TPA: hypothetical protein VJ792_08750 [Candidatus Nitrosotalea sp.]|nr:hypothetical protein [Candidatus Nitrosotalea sp.]
MAKIASIAVIGMIFATSLSNPSYGQVMQENDCAAPLTTTIDASYQGPVVIDAYWVDQGTSDAAASNTVPIKKEVGPGEGASVFAVVINNKGNNPLNSVVAYLNLPSGFTPTGESKIPQLLQQYNPASKVANNYALASYYGQVGAGSTVTLFFNVDVLPTAKVGSYSTNMVINYKIGIGATNLNVQSCTSALLEVPLVLPGKVVMNVVTNTAEISPAKADPLVISVSNNGSSTATGVVATITNLGQKGNSGSSSSSSTLTLSSTTTNIVNLGATQFNLGNIPPNGTATIQTTVFPSTSAAGQTQDVSIMLTYENAWGKQMVTTLNTGIVVTPVPPQSLSLAYIGNGTSAVITSGNLSTLNFAVANNSTAEATNVVVSLVPQSTSVSVVGQSTWTIPKLQPGQQQLLSTQVFAANSLIDTPTSFTLTANYVANGQTQTNSLTLGAFVVGDIKLQIYGLSVNYVGTQPQIAGSLLNQGSTTGLYGTIQLAPSPLLDAIKQARMAYGNGSNFTSASFQSSNNQAADQGGFGGGQGGFGGGQGGGRQGGFGGGQGGFGGGRQGGFGGGQGGSSGGAASQQFLGDLTSDSPIPFSIPLNSIGLLKPGVYQVSFKVVYADDLKNFHTEILSENIMVPRAQPMRQQVQQSALDMIMGDPLILGGIGAAVAGGAAAAVVIRRRKSKKRLRMLAGSDTDIVAVLNEADKKKNEPT